MILRRFHAIFLLMPVLAGILVAEENSPIPLPEMPLVTGGRDFSQFEFLVKRSPFSLPTAEEKSPLADRFVLTGAASWDGKQRVFILDRVSQTRHMVDDQTNPAGMSLLEFLPNFDRPQDMKAKVRVGAEIATLAFADPVPSQQANQGQIPNQPNPNQPNPNIAPNVPGVPNQPVITNANGANPQNPPRRVFRRRVIPGGTNQPTQ